MYYRIFCADQTIRGADYVICGMVYVIRTTVCLYDAEVKKFAKGGKGLLMRTIRNYPPCGISRTDASTYFITLTMNKQAGLIIYNL